MSDDSGLSGPPVRLPKKLIVCCDGTWCDSDNDYVKGKWGKPGHLVTPTNVTRIAHAIKPEDSGKHPQIVYYQAGIGTGIGLWDHIAGGGTGLGLSENIRESYSFLANNYSANDLETPPDSIFLLGFSRGAFTARSLGGLVGAIGLLTKLALPYFYLVFEDWEQAGNPNYTPQFFQKYYQDHQAELHEFDDNQHNFTEEIPQFKNDRPTLSESIDHYLSLYRDRLLALKLTQVVTINAIGVWDTVGSLGIPINPWLQRVFHLPSYIHDYKWFDTTLDKNVKNAFHALALDERRYPFSPALWERKRGTTTNLKQVWFPGVHSNVGGSYADHNAADITLAWMMDQLGATALEKTEGSGFNAIEWIAFDEDYIVKQHKGLLKYYASLSKDDSDTPYIIKLNESGQAEVKVQPDDFRGWAKGTIYDSLTFPTSAAGSQVRQPGRYRLTNYETGRTEPNTLLEDTNEYIHASVRTRIDLGGHYYETDPDQTFPNSWEIMPMLRHIWHIITFSKYRQNFYVPHLKGGPLEGWRLYDGHEYHDQQPDHNISMDHGKLKDPMWKYQGTDPKVQNRMLKEDKLGYFERRLIELDSGVSDHHATVVEEVLESNNGWEKMKKIVGHALRHSGTI